MTGSTTAYKERIVDPEAVLAVDFGDEFTIPFPDTFLVPTPANRSVIQTPQFAPDSGSTNDILICLRTQPICLCL